MLSPSNNATRWARLLQRGQQRHTIDVAAIAGAVRRPVRQALLQHTGLHVDGRRHGVPLLEPHEGIAEMRKVQRAEVSQHKSRHASGEHGN